MTDKLSIKIKIDGREYPLKVDREEEEKYRKAAKIINDIILQYRQKYSSSNTQDFLAMTAFQFALKSIELEEKVDRSPLFDELKKLDEELSDYLSLKE
ncbi:MAG TPA: cell division protein ZapA [Prolixibacteraceae bacterium]|nr:MAG: cell division protein ZapA [Bacteroidetes bacterium GWB2_41_8]HCY43441.1 cell division protein ZapA [Prolixibacteraceae bacterium]